MQGAEGDAHSAGRDPDGIQVVPWQCCDMPRVRGGVPALCGFSGL